VDVSVLVPVRNESEHIARTVAAMRAQRFAGVVEFLFADGESADDTRAQLRRLADEDARLTILDNPRRTTPSGLNTCLRHARGEFVARMDAHTYYPRDYLARGVARLQQGGTEWVSGAAVPLPVGRVSRAVALALQTWMGQGGSRKWQDSADDRAPERELDTGVFGGVWRRSTVLRFGGWDERWPANQDAEMAGRFLAAGCRLIMIPAMGAHYVPRDRLRGLARQYWGYGHYRVQTSRRHPDSMRRSLLATPVLVLTAAAATVFPRPIRGAARFGMALYVMGLAQAAVATARSNASHDLRDVALVPVVLATMHTGHGAGVLQGFVRFGLPWAALLRVAGLGRLGSLLADDGGDVFAPSLHAD
jgi:succinoglycan biosynthesis protein ExoA